MTASIDKTCYVTGKTEALSTYYFGSDAHVVLTMSQEAFAHFIIRAGKDAMHKQIMGDLKTAADNLDLFKTRYPTFPKDVEDYIDASIEQSILIDKIANLVTQKAESGVRILRQIKKDYQNTNKLSS